MKTEKINYLNVPDGVKYLSQWNEFQSKIDNRAIINKKITGSGYTDSLIRGNENWIVAEPYKAICRSKAHQHKIVFAFDGNTKLKELKEYIDNNNRYCIFVTYDSLKKLNNWLDKISDIKFNLSIDEEWELTKSYIFRNKAIRPLLSELNKFDRVQLCSATPFEEKFQLIEFEDFTRYELVWNNVEEVTIQHLKTKYVLDFVRMQVLQMLEEYNNEEETYNSYYFYNSVTDIGKIVAECKLTPELCRIVCAKNERNSLKLPKGFNIETAEDSPKLFNFATTTALSGVDWYDEKGVIFAVCNAQHPHSQFDISTQIAQLAGRIRNSAYKNQIGIIWSPNRFNQDVTFVEFEEKCNNVWNDSSSAVKQYKKDAESPIAKALKNRVENSEWYDDYIIYDEEKDELAVDRNILKFDLLSFKLNHHLYTCYVNLEKELVDNNFKIDKSLVWNPDLSQLIKWTKDKKESFREVIEEYHQMLTSTSLNFDYVHRKNYLNENFKDFLKIYEKIGYDRIKETGFHLGHCKRLAITHSDHSDNYKLYKLLKETFGKMEWYANKDIKSKLQSVYNQLDIKKTAKIKDIQNYFEGKRSERTINGKRTEGCVLIRPTFTINE